MVKKTPKGYVVMNKDGTKPLSQPYKSKAEAEHRLQVIEYFKHKGEKK